MEGSGSGSVQIYFGLGADPGGPKTYGSYGSGSRTLEESNTIRRWYRFGEKTERGKNCMSLMAIFISVSNPFHPNYNGTLLPSQSLSSICVPSL
jgi:hypothetical protein